MRVVVEVVVLVVGVPVGVSERYDVGRSLGSVLDATVGIAVVTDDGDAVKVMV